MQSRSRWFITGPIDAYYGYRLGALEYRSVRFETELLDQPNYPGERSGQLYRCRDSLGRGSSSISGLNSAEDADGNDLPKTVISREYSSEWKPRGRALLSGER